MIRCQLPHDLMDFLADDLSSFGGALRGGDVNGQPSRKRQQRAADGVDQVFREALHIFRAVQLSFQLLDLHFCKLGFG